MHSGQVGWGGVAGLNLGNEQLPSVLSVHLCDFIPVHEALPKEGKSLFMDVRLE